MKAVRRILFLASVCLFVGISIAYYNTSSLGYDDTNMFSVNNEEVTILNVSINYKKIEQEIENIKKYVPDKNITI